MFDVELIGYPVASVNLPHAAKLLHPQPTNAALIWSHQMKQVKALHQTWLAKPATYPTPQFTSTQTTAETVGRGWQVDVKQKYKMTTQKDIIFA